MTKELRRISILVLVMFLALFGSVSWIQVVQADALAQNDANRRTRLDSYEIQRGSILAGDTPIATSTPSGDMYSFQRVYTDPQMWSSVTGYYNPALGSATGIEKAMNSELSGTGGSNFLSSIERIVSGQPQKGANVRLSLDPVAQKAAYDALQGLQGAVVAIEPKTGRILAMVSTPGYDTNSLAVHDSKAANATYDGLVADPNKPLSNRAIGGNMNPPGSTFKLVVAAAALDSGKFTMQSTFPNPAAFTLPGTSTAVHNSWGGACPGGDGQTVSLADAIRYSCNIPMAELAVQLGDKAIRSSAEKFGFGKEFSLPLESSASTYPKSLSPDKTGLTGFGQGDVRATPLQMAMVSAGIANGGVVMNPRMVDQVLGDDLSVLKQIDNSEFGQAMSSDQASAITAAMQASVSSGAAQGARIDGVDVAGKTGTAENGDTNPYTLWFTGFAPASNPEIAVAVVVEDGGGQGQSGSGDAIASPIAKKVMEAVLKK
ncbi:penicillin-binding transpeptidase domain-containing protein [Microbacterium sp. 13-71-7]|jgi:peptidoglycan glycosyltransferase|uniref:peptidoglycan D,D-transpeptidase FtsI family protein n=1 Tax=Microbacterium sp. 13-71-7 TaxID=1970399 RepID=UPI000BD7E42F|nr:penicillin-binding transpeptidase domain-containing protein [Microbacterium sp. 13-71-7]OZB85150.1 MAG: cell division protein FtsI [Microbacterium sp. 13-71-7]